MERWEPFLEVAVVPSVFAIVMYSWDVNLQSSRLAGIRILEQTSQWRVYMQVDPPRRISCKADRLRRISLQTANVDLLGLTGTGYKIVLLRAHADQLTMILAPLCIDNHPPLVLEIIHSDLPLPFACLLQNNHYILRYCVSVH